MKVRCIHNKGLDLRPYEYEPIVDNRVFGRFGSCGMTGYDSLTIGHEYLVTGIILGKGALYYLVDDGEYVSAYPYPLFEVIDHTLPTSWFFKTQKHTDKIYPYQEAIWGYYELVFDDSHYEKLVDIDREALQTYFRRKIELEKELDQNNTIRWGQSEII